MIALWNAKEIQRVRQDESRVREETRQDDSRKESGNRQDETSIKKGLTKSHPFCFERLKCYRNIFMFFLEIFNFELTFDMRSVIIIT